MHAYVVICTEILNTAASAQLKNTTHMQRSEFKLVQRAYWKDDACPHARIQGWSKCCMSLRDLECGCRASESDANEATWA